MGRCSFVDKKKRSDTSTIQRSVRPELPFALHLSDARLVRLELLSQLDELLALALVLLEVVEVGRLGIALLLLLLLLVCGEGFLVRLCRA